jgi:hypothetical protein
LPSLRAIDKDLRAPFEEFCRQVDGEPTRPSCWMPILVASHRHHRLETLRYWLRLSDSALSATARKPGSMDKARAGKEPAATHRAEA